MQSSLVEGFGVVYRELTEEDHLQNNLPMLSGNFFVLQYSVNLLEAVSFIIKGSLNIKVNFTFANRGLGVVVSITELVFSKDHWYLSVSKHNRHEMFLLAAWIVSIFHVVLNLLQRPNKWSKNGCAQESVSKITSDNCINVKGL